MTKTLYDPEVEKRGIEKGKMDATIKNAKSLLDVLDDKTIAEKLEIDEAIVKQLREEASTN